MKQFKRLLGLIAVVILTALLITSCGSAKRCDCPSFGQVESNQADV